MWEPTCEFALEVLEELVTWRQIGRALSVHLQTLRLWFLIAPVLIEFSQPLECLLDQTFTSVFRAALYIAYIVSVYYPSESVVNR